MACQWADFYAEISKDSWGQKMQPVKIVIEGGYWDSQIYSGELILLDANGALHKIDWRQAVDSIASQNGTVQTALRVAFSDSDLFYNPKVRKILTDPQIAAPIKGQLAELANLQLSTSQRYWGRYWAVEESPFKFLPTDTEIYYSQFFAAGNLGLFSTTRSAAGSKRKSAQVIKHHDGRTFQIRASDSHTALAAAAGDDGLFEFSYRRDENDVLDTGKLLAPRPCKACDWAFQSVMGWADEGAFMAAFKERKIPTPDRLCGNLIALLERLRYLVPLRKGSLGVLARKCTEFQVEKSRWWTMFRAMMQVGRKVQGQRC